MEAQQQKLKQDRQLILSVIGSDHPEIITTISEILYRFKGNLEASRFNRIHNKFSGLLAITINHMYLKPFMSCLESLTSDKVKFEFHSMETSTPISTLENEKVHFEISVWGLKERGINIELLRELNKHHLTVDSINTEAHNELGQSMFSSQLVVSTEYVIDLDEVEQALQELASKLNINIMVFSGEERLQEAM
ncbi:MAG: hypothetical protein HWD86_06480 [Kangiellaceae bacterium]|nr:hypothetical protein [Kangiellaceae bacterium]